MNKEYLITEKEFELINILASGFAKSQRELAQNAGISLGMVNLLLKRLVTKGYLRVSQLNRRKVEHLLTAKGFAEKARKSYFYTLKTLHSLSNLKHRIQIIVSELYLQGYRRYTLVGSNDLSDLAEISIRQLNKSDLELIRERIFQPTHGSRIVIWTDESPMTPGEPEEIMVNLLAEVSSTHTKDISGLKSSRSPQRLEQASI